MIEPVVPYWRPKTPQMLRCNDFGATNRRKSARSLFSYPGEPAKYISHNPEVATGVSGTFGPVDGAQMVPKLALCQNSQRRLGMPSWDSRRRGQASVTANS